ncbi:MAG: TetR/AcrR family transcriptional repressor of nem operon [Paracoccaceae bacterium]|jgi:TetR/AcrR family transcriptional repressor of nem operon
MARPREFDTDKALRDMTALFWEFGYTATSMHDLERATGVGKQSLYRAFGDKRGMYLAALAAYERGEISASAQLLDMPGSAAARFGRLFGHIIDSAIADGDRRGCFLCNASTDQAPLDPATGKLIAEMIARLEDTFTETLMTAAPDPLPRETARKSARGIMAGYLGLRVLVKAGAARDLLEAAAEQILSILRQPASSQA